MAVVLTLLGVFLLLFLTFLSFKFYYIEIGEEFSIAKLLIESLVLSTICTLVIGLLILLFL